VIATSIVLALALLEPVHQPIRSHHSRVVKAIDEATRRSTTFRRLVERLNQSDLIIYIESGRCPNRQVMSCIALASTGTPYRYLRVTVDTDQRLPVIVAEIAHELAHAVEIADAPEVTDTATLLRLYRRIGTTGANREVFETTTAVWISTQVSLELNGERGAPAPAPSREPK
jgi:hypothetical protein